MAVARGALTAMPMCTGDCCVMSSLPPNYLEALVRLAKASDRYLKATGRRAVIVGGAAVSFYTNGQILSGDFDIVTDIDFERFLLLEGFRKDEGPGRFLGGYYHPDIPALGFEFVSGALFDGRSDEDKLLAVSVIDGAEVVFTAVEDLIADRLAQYASSRNRASDMLAQARLLLSIAFDCDRDYLLRWIVEDGGDHAEIEGL
jgi:hypothetical protein